jgi:hypothetical protein
VEEENLKGLEEGKVTKFIRAHLRTPSAFDAWLAAFNDENYFKTLKQR